MKQRIYLNVNAKVGRSSHKEERIPYRFDQLIDEMKYYRIHSCCVSSMEALCYSYLAGNREIISLAKQSNRIIPVATVAAFAPFESGEGENYFKRLVDEGAKAFLLEPTLFTEAFTSFFYKDMMIFLEKNKIPAFISIDQASIKDIAMMAQEFPNVSFVLLNSNWGDNRQVYSAMSKLKNLYMDIGCNQANDLLSICKEQGFLDRVLFGTDYPNKVMGGIKALVEYADITEEEKDMVAYLNACKLLNIDPKSLELYSDDELELDEIAQTMDQGKPLSNIKVLDAHTHMANDGDMSTTSNVMLNSGFDDIIKKMDRMGINAICTSPWEGISTNGINGNKTILAGMKKYPNRILGYACCNPNYKEDLEQVYEYYEKYHFPGAKPYWPYNGIPLSNPVYDKWFEYANNHHLIMLVHSDSLCAIEDIKVIVKKYPNIAFVLAHTGSSYDVARAHVEICKSAPNVWLEITYTALYNQMIEYLVDEVGADKVLYGSDLPMRDPAPQMAWVAYAKIPVEDKIKIFGLNFETLLKRCKFD